MRAGAAVLALLLSTLVACKTTGVESRVADAGVVTTPARSQGATAFCWAYAVIAHVEQRYYEQTRGVSGGGFRLDLSEEYLGLMHMMEQLVAGVPVVENMPMSDALALISRHGIVPEPVFNAKFDRQLYAAVRTAAAAHRQAESLPDDAPLTASEAAAIVGKAAALPSAQVKFLAGALDGPEPKFQHSGGTYTPKSFAKNRLKFDAADYYVVKVPSPADDASAYATTVAVMRKALVYGYSLPISFNYVTGSENQAGLVRCKTSGCTDAALAKPSATSNHANHAALLIDYRTAMSRFGALSATDLAASLNAPVTEWVIKNSWGLARSNSYDPQLLERFPFPSFTVLTDEFLRASHRLAPGRYEVIVPRRVCLKRGSAPVCSDLVRDVGVEGVPTDTDTDVVAGDVVAAQKKALTSQDAVVYDPAVSTAGSFIKLKHRPQPATVGPDTVVDLAPQVTIAGATGTSFTVCMQVEPQSSVRYVPVYLGRPDPILPNPMFVLTADTDWKHCTPVGNTPRVMNWVLQAVDQHFKPRQQLNAQIVIK
jgi:hypothetical protein